MNMKTAGVLDEQYWMERYRNGDERALSYFFDLHYRSLCYFAGRLLQDDEEAKDIVSGCFVKLWKSDREVETAQNIKAFLYISCRNACFNHLKQLGTRSRIQTEYYEQLAKEDDEVLYKIVRSEVLGILAREIDLLPEKCKEVFRLIYFEHKKTDEIALELNTNEKSVRYYKAKSIELLKSAMLKKGLSEGLYLAILLFLDRR